MNKRLNKLLGISVEEEVDTVVEEITEEVESSFSLTEANNPEQLDFNSTLMKLLVDNKCYILTRYDNFIYDDVDYITTSDELGGSLITSNLEFSDEELQLMVVLSEEDTQLLVANNGLMLEFLMDSKYESVRRMVARAGVCLYDLIDDESPVVRREVAINGYFDNHEGLPKITPYGDELTFLTIEDIRWLAADSDKRVRTPAIDILTGNKDWIPKTLSAITYLDRERAMVDIVEIKKSRDEYKYQKRRNKELILELETDKIIEVNNE